MSYYFTIIGPHDNPLFTLTFGTSKGGGDGIARFRNADVARHMNQFVTHASLDIVEEVMWLSGQMYLKHIDTHPPTNSHISAFITGNSGVKFLLLHQPSAATSLSSTSHLSSSQYSASTMSSSQYSTTSNSTATPSHRPLSTVGASSSVGANPTSPQTEEAIRLFFWEVYEAWVKAVMSPFFRADGAGEVRSPVFRGRVIAAGRKYL